MSSTKALCKAAENDLDTLRRLIELEKDDNPETRQSSIKNCTQTMLEACQAAARSNHPQALILLLDNGCSILPGTVHAALTAKSKDIFDAFIAHDWDVNGTLGHSGDALMWAVSDDNLEMVQFLISRGADPNNHLPDGINTALEKAAGSSTIAIVDVLLDAGAVLNSGRALSKAAYFGRVDMLAHLLDRGAAITEVPEPRDEWDDYPRRTALCQAAWRGQGKAVEFLLERGADLNVLDSEGKSALQLAEEGGHEVCVGALKRGMSFA